MKPEIKGALRLPDFKSDRMFLDYPCPKCGGNVGHLINCPDGSCFSKKEGIQLNPVDVILNGLRPTMDDEHEKKML